MRVAHFRCARSKGLLSGNVVSFADRARRRAFRLWPGLARRAVSVACLWLAVSTASVHAAPRQVCSEGDGQVLVRACFETVPGAPVYGHGILGDTPEWNALTLHWADRGRAATRISQDSHIFEDIAPRIVDVTGDDLPEVVVVQSSFTEGARLAVFSADAAPHLLAATPYIGRANRWLAPVGVADLDHDGKVELAYVDRPHLAKILRVWRFDGDRLVPVTTLKGLTNHWIGRPFIEGGLRKCGRDYEMITANTDWTRVISTRLVGYALVRRDIGAYSGPDSLKTALICR
ncbi:FG-GAP repeat domain-containing protein [Arenibacterium sp. CAU 1754]